MDLEKTQLKLAQLWQGRSLGDLANEATRRLMAEPGDWDPPVGITPKHKTIPMAIGVPDAETLPKNALADAARAVLEQDGEAAYVYGFGMGYTGLRSQLAERFSAAHQFEVDEDWFQLTNGSAGAIDLICRCLIEPGDVIIAESPTYMGTLRNFRGVLAEIQATPMDSEGIQIEPLSQLIQQLKADGKRIKMIYTISTFQNPTGACLPLSRRKSLLALAAEHNILILDDDAYGELYFGDQPPASLLALAKGYGVITVGTFSKILATGLRVGWIQGDPELVQMMGKMRFAMGLNQAFVRILSKYMENGVLDQHVTSVRQLYHQKMTMLADALDYHCGEFMTFTRPLGGFYLWITLNGMSAESVWRTAAEEGVAFNRGTNFFPGKSAPATENLRLAYPWTRSDDIETGVLRIRKACERVKMGDGA